MYDKVYESDVKTAAEEMLCHAIYSFWREYKLQEADLEQILRLSDGDLLTVIRLLGHKYERQMAESISTRFLYRVIAQFPILEKSGQNVLSNKLYELARQLKSTGFEEKVRIENVFCRSYLRLGNDNPPTIFMRAPEILVPEEKTTSEEEERSKPVILADGQLVSLESYLNTKISVSPQRKTLRIYGPQVLPCGRETILEAFRNFVLNDGWKPGGTTD